MENKFLLGRKELLCVLINLFTVKMLFTYPRNMVKLSGNAAWLQCIFVSLVFLLIYIISIFLYEKIGKINIIKACEKTGGKPLKIIVGLVISIILFSNISVTTRAFPESIKIVLLPLTPIKIITLVFLIISGIHPYPLRSRYPIPSMAASMPITMQRRSSSTRRFPTSSAARSCASGSANTLAFPRSPRFPPR